MTVEELARLQQKQAGQALYSLFMKCRRRFLRSAELLCIRSESIGKLQDLEATDMTPLVSVWEAICGRYLAERYTPQLPLFQDHDTETREDWEKFINLEMFPRLVNEDEVVRNILRAMGGLPCKSPRGAASAVCSYIDEMVLPGVPPLWAPEEALTND
ncbi:MAG: hypothetical protein C4520_04195 [Candidatus Abyssobacteria bacterium SURF_5]|uniref:Uncharacterized protein n=1 Tax=Abyssobacteria bacterium (strain SURF_5) TaxID=2093360 RepID=A0A3A4P8V5_ABYX5|nr:MAG: hypothetical protein C4520_04195 [Candidatus Abyssubacteria bacterium SURF_5]